MAVSIAKRKRRQDSDESEHEFEDEGAMRARFQKAFEARFRPLESRPAIPDVRSGSEVEDVESIGEESDWSGLSEDQEPVETIHHSAPQHDDQDLREANEGIQTSKPPTFRERLTANVRSSTETSTDDPAEAANLKNDLALQRLLKESHLLDSSSFKHQVNDQDGKGRLKALDLRFKDLGAKESTLHQQRMPLSHRRGIAEKATGREGKRRQEAVENGIILEKVKHSSKGSKYRDKSVGGPTVGKFRGGTLKLSSRDLKSMQGDKRSKKRR